ncbi:MAG: class I SAM-dependent methyltransferase [Christensenellaceae bacterium]
MQITYCYENYLNMQYENEFDFVTLIFCDFGVLAPKDRTLLLKKIRTALKPNGTLILDGFTKNQYIDFKNSRSVTYEDGGFWCDVPYMCLQSNYCYEVSDTYLEQYVIATDKKLSCYNIWNQAFDTTTLGAELRCVGFNDFTFYGNVCGQNLTEDSKTICVVAKNASLPK